MRIIHIIESTATGTLAMLRLLSKGQVENGHDVKVIYSRRPETPFDVSMGFVNEVEFLNVQMHSLVQKASAIREIRKVVYSVNPDIVFLHSSFAGFLGRISLVGIMKPKIFYIPHCISFQRKDIGIIKKACFIALEWVGNFRKATYVACSQSEFQAIRKYIPFSRSVTVENAVSEDSTKSAKREKASDLSVICVGQIRQQKDPMSFANIASRIRKDYPGVIITWVGDGDLDLRADLERSGVRVTGWISQEAVAEHLSKATIYLSTSLWEGMPVSLIEAQLSQLAVIARRCPGNVDVIQDGVSGMLFETADEAVSLLASLLNDSERADLLGKSSREVARLRFSEERYSFEMNQLISCPENRI